jgi:hypothetical protein
LILRVEPFDRLGADAPSVLAEVRSAGEDISTGDRHEPVAAVDQVFKLDGVSYAYFHAKAHNPWKKDKTTNLARSKDLVHREKYPGNPLIGNDSSSSVLVTVGGRHRFYTMHPEVRAFEPTKSPGQYIRPARNRVPELVEIDILWPEIPLLNNNVFVDFGSLVSLNG